MDPASKLPADCWLLVIPKSSEKVSLISHLGDLNDTQPRPPHFMLAGWEKVAGLLADYPAHGPIFCTHVDLKNAF